MNTRNSSLKFFSILLIFIIAISSFILWLWQRQPTTAKYQDKPNTQNTEKPKEADQAKTLLSFTPEDGTISKDNKITITGKTSPNQYVIVYLNSSQGVTKSNESGDFKLEVELAESLNLLTVAELDQNYQEHEAKSAAIYQNTDESNDYTTVFAGSVKSIFENLITISTTNGEKTFRQKSSTKLILPESTNLPARSGLRPSGSTTGVQKDEEDTSIRVGDYTIALGKLENEKDFNAVSIEVIRENKPQNLEKFTSGIILTSAKKNPKAKDQSLFSARSQKDTNVVQLILNKDSKISDVGKDVQQEQIIKDRKTLVFYHETDGNNIANLVYLLP